ncbi:MAG TPA: hypothetical protein VE826_07370 [Dongiaceae bacterium]|nr:hypothetical protein [Dongiaceae bacterium]
MTASLTLVDPAALAPGKRAYNNAICAYGGRLLMAYRLEPPDGGPHRIAIAELDRGTCRPRSNALVALSHAGAGTHCEDPRLFVFREKLWLSFTHARTGADFFAQQMYAELREEGGVWRGDAIAPDYGRNRRDGLEKNWTFFESRGALHALYAPWRWELVRIDDAGRCDAVGGAGRAPRWDYGVMSGGTPPQRMPDGRFLTLLHSFTTSGATRVYHVLAAVFAGEPPFALQRISAAPILSGSGGWPLPHAGHANPPWSLFPAGHVLDGDRLVVSLGINDCRCALAELSLAGLALVAPSFR